jgi:hypothetical protein
MSVQFNEDEGGSILYARIEPSSKKPLMVGWLQKTGLVKTETQATQLLLIAIAVCLCIALFSLFTMRSEPIIEEVPPPNLVL